MKPGNNLSFWQTYLAGCNEQLSLPIQSSVGDDTAPLNVSALIDANVKRQLTALAQPNRGSLFNVLHSTFALLLARLSGQTDLNIGLPVTGRHIYGTQDMLGMFLNNLPVRHQIDLHQSFDDFLSSQVTNIEQVLSHQDMPLERILEAVDCNRSTDNTPLFQVMFNMLSLEQREQTDELAANAVETAQVQSKFDLTFYVNDSETGIAVNCNYNGEKFSHAVICQLMSQYVALLNQIAEDSRQPCGSYTLNVGRTVIGNDRTLQSQWPGAVTDLIRQQALKTPHALAVADESGQWQYENFAATD